MNQAEAIETCRRQASVKLNVACAALGISRKTADKRRKIDGCIADGVPVIPVTERTFIVPSAAILRALQLHDFPRDPKGGEEHERADRRLSVVGERRNGTA